MDGISFPVRAGLILGRPMGSLRLDRSSRAGAWRVGLGWAKWRPSSLSPFTSLRPEASSYSRPRRCGGGRGATSRRPPSCRERRPGQALATRARRRSPDAARWLTSLLTTDHVPFSARWPTGHGGMACLVAFVQGHGHGGTETSESMEASVAVLLGPASGRRALTWQLY